MFRERFEQILNVLQLKNVTIADMSGVDRTYISHLKSGKRRPGPESEYMHKLLSGISRCALLYKKADRLCELLNIEPVSDEGALTGAMADYLFSDIPEASSLLQKRKKREHNRVFGERLDRIMSLTGISNTTLSRRINVDASLISRYRSGDRMPRINSDMVDVIRNVIWESINKSDSTAIVAEEMGIPEEGFDEEVFGQWLFGVGGEKLAAESLIDTFESFSFSQITKLPPFESICPDSLLYDDSDVYYGKKGLRTAVIRFLGNVIRSRAPEVYLFSDQNMDWLVSDPDFRMKWALLMYLTVSGGTRIRIVHNIDRGLDEMIEAIKSWLPIYMIGSIEPYYCTRRLSGGFNHTLFLCPTAGCVYSSHIKGSEDMAPYDYHTDERRLRIFRKEYDILLGDCRELITFESPDDEEDSANDSIVIQRDCTRIEICPEYVRIVSELKPDIRFCFRHPMMCRAFMDYAKKYKATG